MALTWPTSGGDAPADSNSGLAGLQYRIGSSGIWYGDTHNSNQDLTDLLANDGSYTTQSSPDYSSLQEGNNIVYFRTWDNAGNISTAYVTTVIKLKHVIALRSAECHGHARARILLTPSLSHGWRPLLTPALPAT